MSECRCSVTSPEDIYGTRRAGVAFEEGWGLVKRKGLDIEE